MFSMDVISLFTNVPIICDIQENLPIPKDSLRRLLFSCTKDIQFQFNGQMYKQIDGVAMGSPLGPLFADIFMSHLEQTVLNEYIAQTSFYKRYVDDTFIVCNKKADAELLLFKFNESHPNIKFTLEHEENGRIPFLDVMINRSGNGSIKRSVYRKSFRNKQYLHLFSVWKTQSFLENFRHPYLPVLSFQLPFLKQHRAILHRFRSYRSPQQTHRHHLS